MKHAQLRRTSANTKKYKTHAYETPKTACVQTIIHSPALLRHSLLAKKKKKKKKKKAEGTASALKEGEGEGGGGEVVRE